MFSLQNYFTFLTLFFGIFLILACIGYPLNWYDCSGYCCSCTSSRTTANQLEQNREQKESEDTLDHYVQKLRNKQGKDTVSVLQYVSGLEVLQVRHQPIIQLAQKAGEVPRKPFDIFVVSGTKGNQHEIYSTLRFCQLLAKDDSAVVLTGIESDSIALAAWEQMIEEKRIVADDYTLTHGQESWIKGSLNKEYLTLSEVWKDVLERFIEYSSEEETIYYVTSEEKEKEVREAYKEDTHFKVDNITSAFHGIVLKSIFPSIHLNVTPSEVIDNPTLEQSRYKSLTHFIHVNVQSIF